MDERDLGRDEKRQTADSFGNFEDIFSEPVVASWILLAYVNALAYWFVFTIFFLKSVSIPSVKLGGLV